MTTPNSLSGDEYVSILDTEKDRMLELDGDDQIAPLARVHRVRNKYTNNDRRAGTAKVGHKKGRGSSKQANARNGGTSLIRKPGECSNPEPYERSAR